ncbi:hypothetical protein N5S92_07500 [Aliarcobacter cryaerophilus]|uniref:hypothetical protein n=1 Tax=Aliarcobacter cryaerophilus TaxID=28198 RepID=UPI0021B4AC75|nr:hypothetical protein [Aliarcobacter cryaerophilus]MCT7501833.1 hypothetical protein [Aliarcobacter cryaerophilus]
MNHMSKKLEFSFKVLILILFLLIIYSCFYILDRGFEITDEAYYLLLAKYSDSSTLYISMQHWVMNGLWKVSNSITAFRSLGMLILVLSSSVLAYGIISILEKLNIQIKTYFYKVLIIISAIATSLLYGETINFSPSYNLLAASGAYFAAGFILLSINTTDTLKKNLLYIAVAFSLTVEFLSKPSSGIATMVLILLLSLYFEKRNTVKISIVIFIFCIFFIFSFLFLNTTFEEAKFAIKNGFELFRIVQSEPVYNRLMRNYTEIYNFSYDAIKIHLYLVISIFVYVFYRKVIAIFIVLFALVYTVYSNDYFVLVSKNLVLQMQFLYIILFLSIVVSFSEIRKNKNLLVILFLLILLPFTVAIGSGNHIFTQIIISLASWGVLISTIVGINFQRVADTLMVKFLSLCFIIFVTIQMVLNLYRIPYHMVTPYIKQSNIVNLGELGYLKVDLETKQFIDNLESTKNICKIPSNIHFFGLYNIPGVALALDAIPPVSPWLNNIEQAEYILKYFDTSKESFIVGVQLRNGHIPSLPYTFEPYKNNFKYCGTVIYPYSKQKIQIWWSNAK